MDTGFINDDSVKAEVRSFEEHLQGHGCETEDCDKINGNLTNTDLATPAKMFLYLISSAAEIKPWLKFYEDIFGKHQPNEMILIINRILITTDYQYLKHLNYVAKSIFRRLQTDFSLQFKTIQNLARHDLKNETMTNITGNM